MDGESRGVPAPSEPDLIEVIPRLASPDPTVIRDALAAICWLGPQAVTAVPAIVPLMPGR